VVRNNCHSHHHSPENKFKEVMKDSKGVRNSSSQGETFRDLAISKVEQNFLHKTTNLVMTTHKRSTHCERLCVSSEGNRQDMDRKHKISSSILEPTILELYM
jgi:hypothetical protein